MRSTSRSRSGQRGFTLVELMIVLVIVAILAAIAVPSYRSYVKRSQRADAKAALLRLAAAEEKFFLQNNRYAIDSERATAPPAGLGVDTSDKGWYTLKVVSPTVVTSATSGFVLTATAAAGGPQATDTDCAVFTVNDRGVKTATSAASADTTAECWK